ncbi:MAG: class II fructose-bisphosphate aldolase [Gammaproteobacteria bacterium]|nr:class II fructose-bisphosphate aldolase [Gammaproteobacteria bacterium]
MAIVDLHDMLDFAEQQGFAIPAFEVTSLDHLEMILSTAEHCNAPVMLYVDYCKHNNFQFNALLIAIENAAQQSETLVAIQVQNCNNAESTTTAIRQGCNATSFNAESSPFNLSNQHFLDVQQINQDCGTHFELQLASHYCSDFTFNLINKTNIRLLHLDIDSASSENQLTQLKSLKPSLQIGFSIDYQIDYDQVCVREAIEQGLLKVNFSKTTLDACRHVIADTFSEIIASCIHYTAATNKADDLSAHCSPWTGVEHLIIFNTSEINDKEAHEMMFKGQEILSKIPGVRRVDIGEAIAQDAQYRFTWLVRFCHPNVIVSYRDHADHVAFANELFRPVAANRISIDYEII